MHVPGRQLGWFIGIYEQADEVLAFALNYSDKEPAQGYAGPKAKEIMLDFFEIFEIRDGSLQTRKKRG